ncbi:hypothetical protein L2E82_48749 [Cichorium intybus]|uniref:Uncharacterized protein n=1 Tax=Cichorium intybus TaxID=13427 RepID=A0ACB8YXX8_CICIN|nr:hypothetical protein L2E82_48749 [Cichorium intybus]
MMNWFYINFVLERYESTGIQVLTRAQTSHPLDPLSAAEIKVAVATVRAAGATPEAVLSEPDKNVVALADAYFFPPFQPSLLPRTKGGAVGNFLQEELDLFIIKNQMR